MLLWIEHGSKKIKINDSSLPRRQNSSFRQVLEAACKKLRLDPTTHTLIKRNGSPVDLVSSLRLGRVTHGTKLKIIAAQPKSGPADVVLQLESGDRKKLSLKSSKTLWDVLLECEEKYKDPKLNLTDWHGVPEPTEDGGLEITYNVPGYMQPMIYFLNRRIASTNEELKSTTLASLGISRASGRVLFKLKHEYTAKVDPEKMQDIQAKFEQKMEAVLEQSKKDPPKSTETEEQKEKVKQSDAMEDEEPTEPVPVERKLRVFQAQVDSVSEKDFAVPDDFYDITREDFEVHKKSIADSATSWIHRRSSSTSKRVPRFRQTVIRVRFPSRIYLEARFATSDTVSELITEIRGVLVEPSANFDLYVTPPRTVLKPTDTFESLRLIPAAIVNISLQDGCIIKEEFLEQPEAQ